MSADDWQQCPICQGLPKELRGGIEHLYGKIPEKEYERRKYEYKKALNTSTVRVYYEYLLLKDKTIFLTMYAKCEMCGAEWKHQGNVK